MFKKIFLSLVIFGFTTSCANAAVITYNFDSLPPLSNGPYTETDFNSNFLEVTFHNNANTNPALDSFKVQDTPLLPAFSGNFIVNIDQINFESFTTATFDSSVNFVSVTLGDKGVGDERVEYRKLFLEAYNSSGIKLDDYIISNYTSEIGYTLTINEPNIAWVKFYGNGSGNSTVCWDNFSFGNQVPIPEPSSMILGTMGLLGLLGARRKKA